MTTYGIGMLLPSSNTTMETEIPAMLRAREHTHPERFAFDSARMASPAAIQLMQDAVGSPVVSSATTTVQQIPSALELAPVVADAGVLPEPR